MMTSSQAEYFFNKLEIEQVLFRYARGVDRKDWDLVRSTYHPDAIDTHGSYEGGVDGFIEHLIQRHDNIEQSMHLITNVIVEFDKVDSALVESYFICYQRLKSAEEVEKAINAADVQPNETLQIAVVGRYLDRFEMREGSWRIARRKVAFDVLETHPTPLGGGLDATLLISRRDRDDVLFKEQREMPVNGNHGSRTDSTKPGFA
jgi:3-phenylpropionate/cinnamic acid dioxygenase small subunit